MTRYPAAVLETIDDDSRDLTNYFVRVFEKGSDRPLAGSFTTIRERDGKRYTIEVSDRFPEAESLDRIEFYRHQFATATIPVRIRADLIPHPAE